MMSFLSDAPRKGVAAGLSPAAKGRSSVHLASAAPATAGV